MKYLLFLFSFVVGVTACDNSNKFASISEDESVVQQSSHTEELQVLVEEVNPNKLGAKKREEINISDTLGEKNLDKDSDATDADTIDADTTNVEIRIVDEVVVPQKKVDIVLYMDTRKSKCIRNLRLFSENQGFLNQLNELDWQVSASFHSQGESKLLPFETDNGKDYVLSKGEYSHGETRELFSDVLRSVHGNSNEHSEAYDATTKLNSNGLVQDPLSGLDHILSSKAEGSMRSDSQTIVLIFGQEKFSYYSSKEWKNFFKKHENTSLIAVSFRSANVSNFLHLLERNKKKKKNNYDFEFLAACDERDSPKSLIEAIKEKVK